MLITSNLTLVVSAVVTVLGRSTPLLISLFIIGLAVVSGIFIYRSTTADTSEIVFGSKQFHAEVASTPAAREQGLSNRDELATDDAMVFVFDTAGTQCFWMRDMKFAIDIVWLDEQDEVAYIERRVDPSTYPKSFCHDAKHVLEFAAGTVEQLKVKVGDPVDL